MLKHRVITALILIPLFVALVLLLPPIAFCAFTGLIVLWGAWEWSLFMGLKKFPSCFYYPIAMIFLLLLFLELPIVYILYASVVWWLVAFVLVIAYPQASDTWGKSILLRGLMGIFVLVP